MLCVPIGCPLRVVLTSTLYERVLYSVYGIDRDDLTCNHNDLLESALRVLLLLYLLLCINLSEKIPTRDHVNATAYDA